MKLMKSVLASQPVRFLTLAAALFSIGLSVPDAAGATYYVAVNGSDSASGSQSSPFATIQHAADVARAGDTVLVNDGVYTRNGEFMVLITRSGSSGSPITFRSINKWGARLDGNNLTRKAFRISGSYIVIEGFEIYDFVEYNGKNPTAMSLYGNHLQIIGNHMHHIGRTCSSSQYGFDALYLDSVSDVTVAGNLIHDIGRLSLGENGCSPGNSYYQNHDHGIYVSGGSGITIRNNILYNINHGYAVHLYPDSISNLTIANNTFAFENPYRDGHIIIGCNISSATIANNISYQPRGGFIRYSSGSVSGMTVRNNLIYPGGVEATSLPSSVSLSGNLENRDPIIVNANGYDFRLQSGSPAIDAGIPVSGVSVDFDGQSRPAGNGYDIGSYEYGGSISVVLPPTNLRVINP